MDRRRVWACMTLAAGLTVLQAAPAFADGSGSAPSGSAVVASDDATAQQPSEAAAADAVPTDQPTDAPDAQTPTTDAPSSTAGGPDAEKTTTATTPTPTTSTAKTSTAKTSTAKTSTAKTSAAKTATGKASTSTASVQPTAPSTAAARAGSAKVAAPAARLRPLADTPSPLSVTLTATSVDVDADGRTGAGDAIDLTATVHATGSDATAIVVAPTATDGTTAFSCPVTTVVAGADVTCTARHELTQADVDAGRVTVTVVATGTAVSTAASVTSDPATLVVPVTGQRSLALKQTIAQRADADHDGRLDAGDLVDVRLTVTNAGTVTLKSLAVSDSLLSRLHVPLTCAATTLAPGASTTCTSSRFAVTRAQATAKVLRNQATATARSLSGDSVTSATSTVSVAVQAPSSTRPSRPRSPKPSVSTAVARLRMSQWVASVVDHDKDGRLDTGDAVTFGFRATNVGSLTVHDLRVVDRRLQRAKVSVHCPVTTLAPGASVVCTSGPVTVVAWQAKQGFGRNFAYATGRTAAGTSVRSNSTVTDVGRTTQSAEAATLPRTGSDLADPALLGLALLLGGVTMTVASRRPARRKA